MKPNSNRKEFAALFLKDEPSRPTPNVDTVKESEYPQLQRILYGFGECARSATERPNEFWRQQSAAIRSRIRADGRRAVNRTIGAWAGVAALLLLGLSLLSRAPASAPPPIASTLDADHDLLVAVERDVQSEVPHALQPAALLAQEMNAGMQLRSINPRSTKEKANED